MEPGKEKRSNRREWKELTSGEVTRDRMFRLRLRRKREILDK